LTHGRGLQIGFKASQWDVDWPTLLATWELADAMPAFDSAWLFDHFNAVRQRAVSHEGVHEAVTAAAALAARTRRLRFGHLVLGNTHRHPALVARMATTIDHVAGSGRFILGLGTGWLEDDHRMFGWPLPAPAERARQLEAAVRVIKGMWRYPDGVTLEAGPYRLDKARTLPPPVSPGGPPLWLGVQGPHGLRLVAEHADGWNANGTVPEFRERLARLQRSCDEVGRDPASIEVSAQIMCIGRDWKAVGEEATALAAAGAAHLVFVILASDGPRGLERLAAEVVDPLRDRFG
jgi:alkanesulfonate monooxygenase SsuD/methylene tetrahydromethanopterin reductase-like flavin-dependent oxidoreductase (luciferase family)